MLSLGMIESVLQDQLKFKINEQVAMDNFYPNTSRSISFKSSWDSGKEQQEKKNS